uniref:Rpn family recombination-promoting nuclease/putative transposase n=1 Tax=Pedobacter schmidteae TaxID=2201271 RepID=UPI000EB2FE74|nr:Rpn family recombination-promoting nuclease/putative transposase [Pedobacter schmidteae]
MTKIKDNRYFDPLTDYGFKRLFGSEPDKDIMIDFLNALFEGEKVIVDIVYSPTEHSGEVAKEKKVLFDLTCTGLDGEKFILEMQRADQKFFSDRCVFYMSRLISGQLPRGSSDWDVPLKEVYLIGIMEFQFNNINDNYLHHIALMNKDTSKVFYKGMGYKFLELPNFDKKESELVTDLDKWFYLLKNLSRLDKIPDFMDKRVFQKVFKIAEMSKMTKEEREQYYSDVKAKSDWNAGIRYAAEKAKAEGQKEGEYKKTLEIALEMKKEELSIEQIIKITKLSAEEIEALKQDP